MALERPFRRPAAVVPVCFIACFAVFVLPWRRMMPALLGMAVFAGLILLAFAVAVPLIVRAYRSEPRSRFTGKVLERYRNISANAELLEALYVDREAGKYFKRVFVGQKGTAP